MNPEDVALPPHRSISIPLGASASGKGQTKMPRIVHTAVVIDDAGSLSVGYRKLMRWYPPAWRAAHEEAMLGALLDQADNEHRTTPTRAERASIIRAGIAQRFKIPPRYLSRVLRPA